MPVFDRACKSCDWSTDFSMEKPDAFELACPKCGQPTERLWLKTPTVVPDTFSTPLYDDVMKKTPQTFYSRSERKAAMAEMGYVEMIRHAPMPGTDKSVHTISWSCGPPAGHDPRPMCQLSDAEQEARRVEWAAR